MSVALFFALLFDVVPAASNVGSCGSLGTTNSSIMLKSR